MPSSSITLPPLTSSEKQLSQELSLLIAKKIDEAGGWVSFEDYMNWALYTPELGYYQNNLIKLGEKGDFITAPLLGNIFAKSVAIQCAEIFSKLDTKHPVIVEFGAGDGSLAVGVCEELFNLVENPFSYFIIDTSSFLYATQKNVVNNASKATKDAIQWLSSIPEDIEGIVIANELLDALPFRCFSTQEENKILELGVRVGEKGFYWDVSTKSYLDKSIISSDGRINFPAKYQGEYCVQAPIWLDSISKHIQTGVVLMVDYGYHEKEFYHLDRNCGTLRCYYKHHSHCDPFFSPGIQDITAHVNFSALVNNFQNRRLKVVGFANQANFIVSLSLESDLLKPIAGASTKQQVERANEIDYLISPNKMGEVFKVLAVGVDFDSPLSGYRLRNDIDKL